MGHKPSDEARRDAAERLWDEHGAAIYRFALRLSGNRSVAEDIAGETILAVLETLGRRDSPQLHLGYLFGIALNKWRRHTRIASDPPSELVAAGSEGLEALIDLEEAFQKLPRRLQEAFVLVKAEGFTSREAAEILRLPQGTVQAQVREAVHRMRSALGEEYAVAHTVQEANT